MTDAAWPNGARCAVAVAVDFDAESVYTGRAPSDLRVSDPSTPWGKLSQGRFAGRFGAAQVRRILGERNVPATWFVCGVDAEKWPEEIKAVVADGFELASHSYTHTAPALLTRDEERSEMQRAATALAKFGVPVVGYRAPALEPSDNTLNLLEEFGFRYVSNLQDDIYPYVHDSNDIVELPTAWLTNDTVHFWFDADSWVKRICSTAEARAVWEEEFLAVREYGGLYVLTVHPMVIGRPSRLKMFGEFLDFLISHDDVWFATMGEIAEHVRESQPSLHAHTR